MDYSEHANGLRTWPTLYKTSSTGKEQQWDLAVVPTPYLDGVTAGTIRVEYGPVGGKIQTATVLVGKGKNLGKANETTPLEQATAEARARWLKQKDKGYAQRRGGGDMTYKPMLAHKYEDCKGKVAFPAWVQPKLDGVRAIAVRRGDDIRLISRQGKEHAGLAHVRRALLAFMREGDVWDGELYTHGMPFQTLVSLVKKDRPDSQKVGYHVYDMVSDAPFGERFFDELLKGRFRADCTAVHGTDELLVVQPVVTVNVQCAEDVEAYHEKFVAAGYEGAMLRAGDCTYRQGYRSRELLKVKAFQEEDFRVVDVVPGVGKMADQGIFVCETGAGTLFRAKPRGRDALRQQYLAEKDRFIGKMLTVTFFSYTDDKLRPVPRFPVGKCVRDYE
jgi:DNA ligase-1